MATKSFDARDKVVLVTGANRGIGRSIIEGFLKAGAKKAYAGVRTLSSADGLVQTYGKDRVVPLHIDVADPATVRRAAEVAKDVDLVVSNAGVLDIVEPLGDKEAFLAALERQMTVNFMGCVHMALEFGPILEDGGGGAFVHINSTSSLRCGGASWSGYAASKSAGFSFVQGLRGSLPGTLVLSVHPGPTATDMIDQIGKRDKSEPPEQVFEAILHALEKGDQFMVFPDTFSRNMGEDYKDFAKKHITGSLGY